MGHAVQVNVVAGLPFLPLTLLFLERAARATPLRNVTLAGLSLGTQCLGGHPQVVLMSAALGAGYALVRLWPARLSARDLVRPAGLVALFVAIGAGISAVYYLPMAELAAPVGASRGRLEPRERGDVRTATAASRDRGLARSSSSTRRRAPTRGPGTRPRWRLYAGLSTLVLAGIALVSRPRDPLVRFFAAAALIALMLALGDATPLHRLLHSLPVVRGLRAPARYVLLVDASLAVLAALGLDSLQKAKGTTAPRRAGLVLAAAAVLDRRPAPRDALLAGPAGGGRLARCGAGPAALPRSWPPTPGSLRCGWWRPPPGSGGGRARGRRDGGRRPASCSWPRTSRPSP